MKTVILAGGLGTRLAEETGLRPKPMVEIGGQPILWHILKLYSHHGFNEFCVALGYKGDFIKRHFLDYAEIQGSMTIDLSGDRPEVRRPAHDNWILNLVETGDQTNTGGRVKRMQPWIDGQPFMVTYGDGVSNVDLRALVDFHRSHGKIATMTAVRPSARFGRLEFEGNMVCGFAEKPQSAEGWINGGFMVFEPEVFDYLDGDHSSLEAHALERLAADGQLAAFRHTSFWQCMDTLHDKRMLEDLWQEGQAPWKVWPA